MTSVAEKGLRELCGGSEIRLRLMRALLAHPDLHLRGLAKAAGVDAANALRLLRRLERSGLCEAVNGRYRVPAGHPLRESLTELFAARGSGAQARLDEIKRLIGVRLLERHSLEEIRRRALQNLGRWRAQQAWSPAYEEWQGLLEQGSDAMLRHVLVSRDPEANRLRQSMPYVGLLPRDEVRSLNEEVAA
jgi:DNA-binding MarR family transcriptional regulator